MPNDSERKVLIFAPRESSARRDHQIWQYTGLEHPLDAAFPDQYRLHSTVKADDPRHAYAISLAEDFEAESEGRCRFTRVGDVIVDPTGTAHRIDGEGGVFREIEQRVEAKVLYAEWRSDYAARSNDSSAEARQLAKEREVNEIKGPEIG